MGKWLKTLSWTTAVCTGVLCTMALPAFAEMSPTLIIETGPSDNPAYRRMIFVKYLVGTQVSANYKTYNRREFINTPNTMATSLIAACAYGPSTSLNEIKAYEREENRRAQAGQAPEQRTFCIKNISDWTDVNKDKYLDPIFQGLP
ncbi:MAG: hypothetical protein COA69_12780 [Robiginitomaculum sp.]|nr:MAG: hypothetical protein COA69_12780 [Robiginitomaculum sp.]